MLILLYEVICTVMVSGIILSRAECRSLAIFANDAKDKCEYRAATGVLLRSDGQSADSVGRKLGVTPKQVFLWCRKFNKKGVEGLKVRKRTGRPPEKKDKAKKVIPKLLQKDPQAFGYFKGRWVLRDIARQLQQEGIQLGYTGVHRALGELGIKLKQPKLRAPGSLRKNYQKRAEIKRYKQVSSALLKKE